MFLSILAGNTSLQGGVFIWTKYIMGIKKVIVLDVRVFFSQNGLFNVCSEGIKLVLPGWDTELEAANGNSSVRNVSGGDILLPHQFLVPRLYNNVVHIKIT